MPAKTFPPEVFQLKVTLLGTMPPIWRRLLAPADRTLAQLHDVLQTTMGWQDCHMHEFSAGQRHFGTPNPEDRLMGIPPVESEHTVRLSSVLGRVGAKVIYYTRMIWAIAGSMALSWRSVCPLTQALPIRSARAANEPVPLKIAAASAGFMTCWMPLETPRTNSTTNSWTGLAMIMTPTLSP